MAKGAQKKKGMKPGGERVKLIVCILLACACVALFLIFGRPDRALPSSAVAAPTPLPAPTAVPKGVTMKRFIDALRGGGMSCEIGEVRILGDNAFAYPLRLPDGRGEALLELKTDSLGRVIESALELAYIYAGEPDESYSEPVADAIRAEYRKREKGDCALIRAYLESICELLSEDCKISTIDGKKLLDSIESAYYSRKTYDKKAGSARFYCETEDDEKAEFNFTFRLIASFDYSKS